LKRIYKVEILTPTNLIQLEKTTEWAVLHILPQQETTVVEIKIITQIQVVEELQPEGRRAVVVIHQVEALLVHITIHILTTQEM